MMTEGGTPDSWKPAFDQLNTEMEVVLQQLRAFGAAHELAREMHHVLTEQLPNNIEARVAARTWAEADSALATGGIDA